MGPEMVPGIRSNRDDVSDSLYADTGVLPFVAWDISQVPRYRTNVYESGFDYIK